MCEGWRLCGRFIANIAYFVYYVAASILCFFIYREFKGVSFDKNSELARYLPGDSNSQRNQPPSLTQA
jgi:hypothetical protein